VPPAERRDVSLATPLLRPPLLGVAGLDCQPGRREQEAFDPADFPQSKARLFCREYAPSFRGISDAVTVPRRIVAARSVSRRHERELRVGVAFSVESESYR
jgi:hypothetical protein